MKFSDYKNEDAIELLVDLIDPLEEIANDEEIKKSMSGDIVPVKIAKVLLKKHPKELLQILARIDGTPVEKYKISAAGIVGKLVSLLNNEDFLSFFTS